jgi:hypothetical protein
MEETIKSDMSLKNDLSLSESTGKLNHNNIDHNRK